MIEALIERALHAALRQALECSLQEAGLSPGVAREMGSRPLTRAPVDEERVDAAAAAALDVEEEDLVASSPVLSLPPEAPIPASSEGGTEEIFAVEELVAWMVPALEDGATWADIPRRSEGQGQP